MRIAIEREQRQLKTISFHKALGNRDALVFTTAVRCLCVRVASRSSALLLNRASQAAFSADDVVRGGTGVECVPRS